MMMEEQLDRAREDIRQMDKVKAEIEGVLEQLRVEGLDADAAGQAVSKEASEHASRGEDAIEESRLVWDLIEDSN